MFQELLAAAESVASSNVLTNVGFRKPTIVLLPRLMRFVGLVDLCLSDL